LQVLEKRFPLLLRVWETKSVLIAQPTRRGFLEKNRPLPQDVRLTARPLQGRCIRQQRNAARALEPIIAQWPEDHLLATRTPILLCALEGQVCLLPSALPRCDGSEPHLWGERRQENARCELLWIKGGDNVLEAWICHSQGERHWIGRETGRIVIPHHEARLYFATLEREAAGRDDESRRLCRNILQVLFILLLRELRAGRFHPVPAGDHSVASHSPHWDPIHHVQDYVREHLSEHHTVESAARSVFMADSTFAARFKAETGETFNRYLTRQRLERAQALLCDTNWTVESVAAAVGVNPSHLRRLFIHHLGRSPQQFRHEKANFCRASGQGERRSPKSAPDERHHGGAPF
jgi:AraC-like DNA-binding protein